MSELRISQPVSAKGRPRVGLAALPAVVGLAFGLVYSWGALSYQMGTLAAPGPGMFPLFVGLVVTIPSAWCLVNELRRPGAAPEGLGDAFWRVPALTVAVAAFALLLKPLGFLPAAALMLFATLLVLGRRPWWVALLIALVTAAVAFYGFTYLGVPLPAGILG